MQLTEPEFGEKDQKEIKAELRASKVPVGLTEYKTPDLNPRSLQKKIKQTNMDLESKLLKPLKVLLTTSSLHDFVQQYDPFFKALDTLDEYLGTTRYLNGDYVTESDIILYTALIRFDIEYSFFIGPIKSRIADHENIYAYLRDLYQIPQFQHHTDFQSFLPENDSATEDLDQSSYFEKVVPQTDFDAIYRIDPKRARLSKDPGHKFLA